jgi:hypothetical protein
MAAWITLACATIVWFVAAAAIWLVVCTWLWPDGRSG